MKLQNIFDKKKFRWSIHTLHWARYDDNLTHLIARLLRAIDNPQNSTVTRRL